MVNTVITHAGDKGQEICSWLPKCCGLELSKSWLHPGNRGEEAVPLSLSQEALGHNLGLSGVLFGNTLWRCSDLTLTRVIFGR